MKSCLDAPLMVDREYLLTAIQRHAQIETL